MASPVWPDGSTRVAGVIGDPVRHSLSPVLHNAAFRALDLDWVFLAFPVPPGSAPDAIKGMRALAIDGLSVTMPHKEAVVPVVDRLTPAAERLGAVNAIAREGTTLVGHNTDGAGFLDALLEDEAFEPAGKRCLVAGAGGAARAVVLALAEAGASEVAVLNRTPERAEDAAAMAGGIGRLAQPEDVAAAELVVNATPLGMAHLDERDQHPIDAGHLHAGQVVVDLVYHPPVTPLLAAARRVGAVAVNGVGMLVHQAGHAFRLWTGYEPPLDAMSAAVLGALPKP